MEERCSIPVGTQLKRTPPSQLARQLEFPSEAEDGPSQQNMERALELASKANAQAELARHPTCEEMIDVARMSLKTRLPAAEVMALDDVPAELRDLVAQKKTMQEEKRKKEARETEQQEERILSLQLEIHELEIQLLMSELSSLKSDSKMEETTEPHQMRLEKAEGSTKTKTKTKTKRARGADGKFVKTSNSQEPSPSKP